MAGHRQATNEITLPYILWLVATDDDEARLNEKKTAAAARREPARSWRSSFATLTYIMSVELPEIYAQAGDYAISLACRQCRRKILGAAYRHQGGRECVVISAITCPAGMGRPCNAK